MSERDVRELAEEIFEQVTVEDGVDGIEVRLRAFLAEREAERAGALAALRGALNELLEWCPGCPGDGVTRDYDGDPEPCGECFEVRTLLGEEQ